MPAGKRSSAAVRSRERAAAARTTELGWMAACRLGLGGDYFCSPLPVASQPLPSTPSSRSSLGAAAFPN